MTELMTVEELGQYLRFTKKTIYKLLKQGSIPALRIGNKWRFDRKAIDDWLHQSLNKTKARILVIDDDDIILSLFKEILESEGHKIVTAATSAEGIERLGQQDFNLVFLDLKMPDIDGADLLKQIKNTKPAVPVTIITGYPGSEVMERALKQGPFGVMEKPFDVNDILSAVNSFLHIAPVGGQR
jgi:excisionase family DNA binding protein